MNNIGIIGAMDEEVNKLKKIMTNVKIHNLASMEFYEGELNNKNVIVVRSGIGKVNAAICTQILIDKFNVEGLINTGIAGALDAKIDIADMVLSKDALQHDMDATGFGYKYGEIPRMKSSIFVADTDMIEKAHAACIKVNPDINVYIGRILSGDEFVQDKEKKSWLLSQFKGYCVEMEGAAIAHVASLNNVPFLIIRGISDKADDSAQIDYDKFEAKAIENSVRLVLEMLANL